MGTYGHVYQSPQPKSFEELSEWLQQSTFSLSTIWDILNSHQVVMDNLHAAQMELNVRICDPTTQSRSRAEPEDPICSPYLFLLRFRPVSALLPDLSLRTIYHLISPSSLLFTC